MCNAVLVIGGINVDVIYDIERLPLEHEKLVARSVVLAGGGSAANTAYWLAQLNVPVHLAGFAGKDVFGDYALSSLAAAGAGISSVVRLEGYPTTIVSIFSNGRSKSMVLAPAQYGSAAAQRLIERISALNWDRIIHVHCATHDRLLIEEVMRVMAERRASLSLELDGMYDEALVRRADIAFCNMEELGLATGATDPADFLAPAHLQDKTAFVITDGRKGATVICKGHISHVPTKPVQPVDRTGGGDAFDAGFLAAYLRGEDLHASAGKGLALASFVIRKWGARPIVDAAFLRPLAS
jgi:ribokinase